MMRNEKTKQKQLKICTLISIRPDQCKAMEKRLIINRQQGCSSLKLVNKDNKTAYTSTMTALASSAIFLICCLILCFRVSGAFLRWRIFFLGCFVGFTSPVEQ